MATNGNLERLDNLAQQTDMRPPFMHLGSSHNYSVEQLFKAQLINLIKAQSKKNSTKNVLKK